PALVFTGASAWGRHLSADVADLPGIGALLEELGDAELERLMTNLAGHDLQTVLEAFHSIDDDQPTCFICYTVKGYQLPLAGHKDNHAGLMTPGQMADLQRRMGIAEGQERARLAGLKLPPQPLRS